MNSSKDLKKLADDLDQSLQAAGPSTDPIKSLEEAKKAAEKVIKHLSDDLVDLRGDVEMGIDDSGFLEKSIGKSYYRADKHIEEAVTFYKALISRIDNKTKELKEQKKDE